MADLLVAVDSTTHAKGDLTVGTAADGVGRLAVGADGLAVVADSAEATGLKYAAPAPAAHAASHGDGGADEVSIDASQITSGTVAAARLDGNATVNTVAATGATETLSAASTLHKVTMDQDCTFTFTSPTAGAVFAVNLVGAFTPTFPASVDWPDGTAPTYTSPSLYVFATFDGGTTWLGTSAGKAFA